MKDRIFGVLQRVGRSFMLPIAILPVAGLFLGIGSSFTNATMLEAYGLTHIIGPGTLVYTILMVLSDCGSIIFDNLPLIFAVGVAIGMAKKEKDTAALAGVIAFFIMHAAIGAMLRLNDTASTSLEGAVTNVLGIESLQMGVFGGIIVGLGVAGLHNRFYNIKLPQVLSFFGGTRFVPIISAVVYALIGIAAYFIWPVIQQGIFYIGYLVRSSGYAGTWVYGIMERALIPFGLHHVFYMPFWQTALGGSAIVAGELVEGAQNIFFAELAAENVSHFNIDATRFMAGKFPFMIFGLPGAALAMYRTAKPENKKAVGGLLLSAALTSILTGITEPLEFTFLFVAPFLYVIHCVLAGLSYMLMHLLGVGVGMTFSGGLIDLLLFGVLQGNAKTNWVYVVLIGAIYAVVYYFLFYMLIRKFNLKTPGREDKPTDEIKLYTRADVDAAKGGKSAGKGESAGKYVGDDAVSALILQGLGGKGNISDLDCCATRLRITVLDGEKVEENTLEQSGAIGVIVKGQGVQVIYGPQVSVIKSNLQEYIQSADTDNQPPVVPAAPNASSNSLPEPNVSPVSNVSTEPNAPPLSNATASAVPEAVTSAVQEVAEEMPESAATVIYAPMKGDVIPLSSVPDDVFAQGILGKGAAIVPESGEVFAPASGTIAQVSDTKHAIGITTDSGVDILIHIGIDTVKLGGKYYDVKVAEGDRVTAGDLLVSCDLKGIAAEGYELITPVVIVNSDDYSQIQVDANETARPGEALLIVR